MLRHGQEIGALAIVLGLLLTGRARADQDPAVLRGVQWLKTHANNQGAGESALSGLALVKAGATAADPALQVYLRKLDGRFNGSLYTPERAGPGGASIYEAAITAMLYANLAPEAYRPRIQAIADYLMANQQAAGGWDYAHRSAGDCSISQYGVLGLWESENAGIKIPPRVWENAARFYLSVQDPDGGWRYHPDEPGGTATVSMTAAGVGSLLVCQRQLEPYRHASDTGNPLLAPLVADPTDRGGQKVSVSNQAINAAVNRGRAWIGSHFVPAKDSPVFGPSVYYGLYGMERVGALAGRDQIGGLDWFVRGRSFILGSQEGDGHWTTQHGDHPNTAWAVLFLVRATSQSLRKIEIKRLGAGMLIGGRGLPKDLSTLTVAGGRVLTQPMNGAIEGMLATLEDARSDQADAALAGLVDRYRAEGPAALRPHRDRFLRMLKTDPDPGIRGVAAWALARCQDLTLVPELIGALEDPDDQVVSEARGGLELLSRKLEGFGPASGADAAAKHAAAQKWREWYDGAKSPSYSRDPETP
jgi:hypothetical protein